MTPEQLKTSILKFAFEGKLVEQIKQDKTVEDEIKELGITESQISEEEKDDRVIPDTWKLIKLKDLVSITTGKKDANYGSPDGIYDFFTCSAEPIKSKDYSYDGEYLIMPGNGANIGMVIYFSGKFEAYQRTYLLENIHSIDMKYLKYHLESNWKSYNADKMFGSAIPYIKLGNLQNYIVSFPPIEEQHRIVTKIEEILPLIEKYAEAYEKLEKFNTKFPDEMKKSILQYAIQGKLVEQRVEEGTAEELYELIQSERKLYKIKELKLDDICETPFDIPETWKWVHLQDIVKKTIKRGKSPKYAEKSDVQVFAQKCNVKTGGINMNLALFLDDAVLSKYPEEEFMCNGDIVINSTGGGTMGRVGIFHDSDRIEGMKIVPDGHVTVIRACDTIDYKYLYYFIKHNQNYLETQGEGSTNQTELKPITIASLVLPLPPLEEQHRIVKLIEKLLPFCERLK